MKAVRWGLLSVTVVTLSACSEAPSDAMLGVDAATPAFAKSAAAAKPAAKSPTLVDVALSVNASSGEFSTLIAALVAADLVDAIAAPGQRTVFAPRDAAFAELGLNAGNIGSLGKEAVANILLYHVVPGRRAAAEVLESERMRMSNGGFTTISLREGAPYINDSEIIATDVLASNGIIHVIDAVLLP